MSVQKVEAWRDKEGRLHDSEIEAMGANFSRMCNSIDTLVTNMDGTRATPKAAIYRLGVECSETTFEQYVEAARSLRVARAAKS